LQEAALARHGERLLAALLLAAAGCEKAQTGSDGPATLEFAIFEGGYGLGWHERTSRAYEALAPGVRVSLWGSPRVSEKLRPRILRGNPPELALCDLPIWLLMQGGKLRPLDLSRPAYGQPGKTWGDTFLPGVLDLTTYQGHCLAIPTEFGGWVIWYDRKLWRDRGWQVPRTWADFERVCQEIKKAGLAPFAFQGKYPSYAIGTFFGLVQRAGGLEAFAATQNLEPGAWLAPPVAEAARLMQHIALDYFDPNCMALSHIESQMEFVNRRCAMVACGLWLKHEMEQNTPPDFELSCFDLPPLRPDVPYMWQGGGSHICMVFRDAPHAEQAEDFLRFLTSRQNMARWIEHSGSLAPVRGAADDVALPPDLKAAKELMDKAAYSFQSRLSFFYPGLGQTMVDQIRFLITGQCRPEAFCQAMEAACQTVRGNPRIPKAPPMEVPAKFRRASP